MQIIIAEITCRFYIKMKIKQNLIVSIMNLTTRQSDKWIGSAKEKTFKTSCPGEYSTVAFEITYFFPIFRNTMKS